MAVEGRGEENVMIKERGKELKVYERKRKRGGNKIGEDMKEVQKVNMSRGLVTAEEPAIVRSVRDRKVVERLSFPDSEKAMASKGFIIKKGQGIQLKDIPNVASNLSKRKADGNLQMLHTILFGKKSNQYHIKRNISQFSGFVWATNEEKEREKLVEKIEKCVKDMLFDFCQLLDVPITKAAKKVELSTKLLKFLECPHATTELGLDEKDQVKDFSSKKEKTTTVKRNSTSSQSVTNKSDNVSAPSMSDSKACLRANAELNQQEMLTIVSDVLRTIDFEHATLDDILKELEGCYNIDLSHKKAEVGSLIEEAINNMTAKVRNLIEEAVDDLTENEEEEGEDEEMNFWNGQELEPANCPSSIIKL